MTKIEQFSTQRRETILMSNPVNFFIHILFMCSYTKKNTVLFELRNIYVAYRSLILIEKSTFELFQIAFLLIYEVVFSHGAIFIFFTSYWYQMIMFLKVFYWNLRLNKAKLKMVTPKRFVIGF